MIASRADAEHLDARDPLAARREEFSIPDGVIYLDGNSLGPPTKATLKCLNDCAEREWGEGLIRSWNDASWIDLPKTCGAKIARIIGARKGEVIVCDSVSVNLFKLAAALSASNSTTVIAIDADEFPTDSYIVDGLARMTGATVERLEPNALPERDSPFVLVKSLVHYRTGAVADMPVLERAAQVRSSAIIWDLSHAAGVLDVDIRSRGARYAVGCGYKFLNGGPGAPAFVYVAAGEANRLNQPLSGWMGHAAPFDFAGDYTPAAGVARFAAGTPPILSMSALDAAMDLFDGVNMKLTEEKARLLGDLFLSRAKALGLRSISPELGERRGGQVSLLHDNGYQIMQALIARGVIGDFRPPNIMRFGFSPLTLSYAQVWDATVTLEGILKTEEWRAPQFAEPRIVT